jgi:hypothetical protein
MNGITETLNRAFNDKGNSMMKYAGLDYSFWDEAVSTALQLDNEFCC